MADYYNDWSSSPAEQRRGIIMILVDVLLAIFTYLMAIIMALTLLVPYINPAKIWFLPILGLAAPAIYLVTVLLALYWVIRWRWFNAGLMLVLVFMGLFSVSLFYKPEFRRNYAEKSFDRAAFKVMTYNVRCFYGADKQSSANNVFNMILENDPDILCLQEYNIRLADSSDQLVMLEEKYEAAVFGRTPAHDSLYNSSLAIFSKYRILRTGMILGPSESVWADVLLGDDTVRVFNNHLRSTAIKASDNDYITNKRFLSDTASEVKIRSIVSRFRDNSVLRAIQVDSIARFVESVKIRKIVCGDFNDTPISYVYRSMAKGLNDAFSESGAGYSHTFQGFFNILRIDYVLSSDGFDNISYDVIQENYSDHHPVVVRLKKRPILNN